VLIGTYKLLILGHYLPQRFFVNDLLQACTPTPYIMAESSSDLQVRKAEPAFANVVDGQASERRRAAEPFVI
jgi:hypothetical protein